MGIDSFEYPTRLEFLQPYEGLLAWLSGASLFMLIGSLIFVGFFLARIPADYFVGEEPPQGKWESSHPVLCWLMRIARNAAGFVLIVAGVAMLVLPGQGLLTILIGLILMDFPGKRRMELRLVERPEILRGLNWFRKKARQEPFAAQEPG